MTKGSTIENADGIRQDFPRVPLPLDHDAFLASVNLGHQIATLLDTDHPAPSISAGTPRPELKAIGAMKRVGGGSIDLMHDVTVTVGWGHPGKDNIVMPGKGRIVERPYTEAEQEDIAAGASDLGLTTDNAFDLLGWTTHDVYLNEVAFWSNVPTRVWEYTVGGYQVIKKWLSYREGDLLGRSLKRDEVRDVTHMARRIAALLLLEPALDANYQRSKQASLVVGA